MDQVDVLLEILAHETRIGAPEIALGQIVDRFDLARQKAPAQRAVGHEADAQFVTGGEQFVLGLAAPERILGLQGGDRVFGMAPAQGRRRGL